MGRPGRGEGGFTLIEVTIAMVLLAIVVAGVDASITVINNQQVTTASATQNIDVLQTAEETLTSDIHAATSWHATPTTTSLDFYAAIDGSSPEITATIANHILTVTVAGKTLDTVRNLSSSSTFVPESCHVTVAGVSTTYYVGTGVTLSMWSPGVASQRPVKTTLSDPTVTAWNIQYSYQVAEQQTGASSGCP